MWALSHFSQAWKTSLSGQGDFKSLTLLVGQIVILQRQQNVLPGGVRIGTVQNFFRGQRQEVLPIAFLLGKHLLIELGVQFLIGDKINFLSFGVQKSTRCV